MYRHIALRVVVPALAGAAVCASTASAATVVEPSAVEARTFATTNGGWSSAVDYGNLSCIPGVTCPTAQPGYRSSGGSGGAADGHLRDTFGTLLGVLSTTNITWTSPTFVAPTGTDEAELAFNVRPYTASLQVVGSVSITPRLVDVDNPADTVVLPTRPITQASASFGRQAFTVPAASIVPGRTYRIQITVSLTTNVSAVTSGNVDLDDVALTLTDLAGPADLTAAVPATGPLRVTGSADANGVDTDVSVEYGPTTAYGSTTSAVRLAGTTTGAQPFSIPLTGLQAGATYHYRVRAENADGTLTTTDATFVAPSPPSDAVPTITGDANARQRTATFARAGDVTAAVVELLNTDGSVRDSWSDTNGDGSETITLPEADGTYDLRVRRTTTRGLESVSATVPVALDRTAPSVSGLNAAVTPAVSNVRGRTLTLTRPSDAATVRAQVIDADGADVGAPVTVTGGSASVQLGATDGSYRVRITATDAAGNEASATTTAVTLDRVAPAAGAAPTVTGAGNARRRTVQFTRAPDAASAAVEVLDADGVTIDTVPVVGAGAEADVTLPDADGAYAVRVLQTDAAGNPARTPAADLTLDRVAPNAGPAPTVTGAVNARLRTVTFTRDADASSVAVEIVDAGGDVVDTVPVASGASTDVTLPDTDGTYTIRVRQTDAAGNDARTPGSPAVLDATGPQAGPAPTVTGAGNVRDRTVTFTRAPDTAAAAVELLDADGHVVDTVPVAGGARAELTLPDADGTYAVRVRQTDAAGNDTRTATTEVLLDREAPVAGPAPRIAVSSDDASEVSVSFVRAADAADVTVEVLDARRARLSAVSVPTGDTARVTLPREAGRYTIRVVQTDLAGNSTVTAETTIERAAPQPEPKPAPPAEPVRGAEAECRTATVVTEVVRRGRRIVVRGFTTGRSGTTLTIYDGFARKAGTAVVGADGTFTARVVPVANVRRGDVRYRAVADGRSSSSVQLNRANELRTVKRTSTTVTLEGRVDVRRMGRVRTVLAFGGSGTCPDPAATLAPIGRAKVDAQGRYRLTVRADAAGRLMVRTRVFGTRTSARSVYVVR